MLKVKLVRVHSNHTRLRTGEVVGKTTHAPQVGTSFVMFAEALTKGAAFRVVNTSEIKTCEYDEKERKFSFATETGSVYEVYVLDPDKDPLEYRRLFV